MGEYEPNDSRNVTGAGNGAPQQSGVRSAGGADQHEGGQRWNGDGERSGQMNQQQGGSSQMEQQSGGSGQQGDQMGYGSGQDGRQNQGLGGATSANSGTEGSRVQFTADPQLEQQAGSQQQQDGSWGSGQQEQFQNNERDQQGGSGAVTGRDAPVDQQAASQVAEHMEVIGADGVHLGTVDHVEGGRIKLTKKDSGMGAHEGHHHYIPLALVAGVEGDKVRLSANADVAYGMEEEE